MHYATFGRFGMHYATSTHTSLVTNVRRPAMAHILTVALNAAVDTTMTIRGRLKVGETHKVRDVLKLSGGKGLNVARVLLTTGLPVHVTGLAGGPAGEFI